MATDQTELRISPDDVLNGLGGAQKRPEIVVCGETACIAASSRSFGAKTLERAKTQLGDEYVIGFIDGWDSLRSEPNRKWTARYLAGVQDGVSALEYCMKAWTGRR